MKTLLFFAVFASIGLPGCQDSAGTGSAEDIAPSFWQLVAIETDGGSVDLTTLVEPAILEFGDIKNGDRASFSGFSGCNQFSGEVILGANRLEILGLSATEIGCPPPIGNIERAYFEILTGSVRYETDIQDLIGSPSFSPPAPTLIIESEGGAGRLVFNGFTQ
jgi:heat shock protein HslJ